MDEESDFDYDMAPQGAQHSAEEFMDDIVSVATAMSDSGMHSDPIDKAAIDVDFQDSANRYDTGPNLPALSEPSAPTSNAHMKDGILNTSVHLSSEDQIYDVEAIQQSGDGAAAASLATNHVQEFAYGSGEVNSNTAGDSSYLYQDDKQLQGHEPQSSGADAADEDELTQAAQLPASQHGAKHLTTFDEVDQLDDHDEDEDEDDIEREEGREGEGKEEGEQDLQGYHEESEGGEDVYENGNEIYQHPEDQEAISVRVTFNGQDFVIWSNTDISAYLASSSSEAQTTEEENHGTDGLLHVEAPALEVVQEVLWQPLDSLFASLREQKALGDFLEESHELHLSFPDLDLEVAEDNLYCREITLDDLLQLHHGLGLVTSLHIQVSERPRFITKYNELAQHVTGILGSQLQHSSDEEEEVANSDRRRNAASRNEEATIGSDPKEPEKVAETTVAVTGMMATDNGVTAIAEASVIKSSMEDTGFHEHAAYSIATKAPHGGSPHHQGPQSDVALREPSSQANVTDAEHQDSSEALDELEEYRQDNPPLTSCSVSPETPNHKRVAEGSGSPGVQRPAGEAQDQGRSGGEDEVTGNTNDTLEEQGENPGEGGTGDGEWEEDASEVQPDHARAFSGDVPQEGDEEYEDDARDYNEEAEQTFYTINNDISDAEEDELEDQEGEDAGIEGRDGPNFPRQSAEDFVTTYAYETVDDQQGWQGKSGSRERVAIANQTADAPAAIITLLHVVGAEGAEDQIVEYTEDQSQSNAVAGPPSSAASATYETSPQHKRGLSDDEDDAQYEEGDHETGSKRVKVD